MAGQQADNTIQFQFPSDAVSFDPDAFDLLLRTQGVEMVHYRALPCPVGLIDPDDQNHPREHHVNCSNGYIYLCSGKITCGFLSNSKESRQIDVGRIDGSTVIVTFPRFYDRDDAEDPEVAVQPCPFDRLYLKDENISVVTWEKYAASITGVDKLRYPALHVVDLMDATGKMYKECDDFKIVQGRIVWNPDRSPGLDPTTQRGVVMSVRYVYRPFWYVQRMLHEIRVAQVENEFTGVRETVRFPQQMLLQREHVFENEQADIKAKPSDRQNPGPNDRPYTVTGLGTK